MAAAELWCPGDACDAISGSCSRWWLYSKIRDYLAPLEVETVLNLQNLYEFPGSSPRERRSTRTRRDWHFLSDVSLVKLETTEKGDLMASDINNGKKRSVNPREVRTSIGTVGATDPTEDTVGFRLCDRDNSSDCAIYTFSSGIHAIQDWYRLNYMNYLAEIPMEEKIDMGYSAEEFIIMCSFDGISCDFRNFTLFHHPLYGNCYTFNGGETGRVLASSTGGRAYGLQVVLYIDKEEYNPFLVTSTGAKILIHDQNEYPFIEDIGTEIQPATETSIGMQLTESSKLSAPYSNCTMDGSDVPVTNLFNKSYTLNICLHSCFQKEMVATCGCGHYDQPLPEGAQYCSQATHPSWVYCYYKLHEKFNQEQLGCEDVCRESCSFKEWTLSSSLAHWPALMAEEWMLRVLSWEMGSKITKNLTKNDLVNVVVYYKDLNMRALSENPSNNIVLLLSNFGGQLGLWMSCSMVCVIEIVEVFLVDCSWVIIRQYWWKLKSKRREQKESEPQQTSSRQESNSYDNAVTIGDEDPPTFNTALQLPQPPQEQVPRTPPPNYNTLRIHRAFVESQAESEQDIQSL
ncbi:amiloride-sensitive sodium channel subunit gamma isoform X2 [Rhinatrema bivittatum]|uniref:amiloride-sensitive sodium channel subunit gamma isoform X2 n=1 Tax=Rhinatrema bivittatum TaxID=194408 RepID=UPI00112B7151|nr:amiloride-sensitive sodium channel subunit gamma isoform X2 [Rhinatrema bivittatum]